MAIFNYSNNGTLQPQIIKGSATTGIQSYDFANTDRAGFGVLLWFYDSAAPVYGVTTPLFSLCLPPGMNTARTLGAGEIQSTTALSVICTRMNGTAVQQGRVAGYMVFA